MIIISLIIITFSIILIINNGKNGNQVQGVISQKNNLSFEEKKAIIDDLNEKFDNFRKSDNIYYSAIIEDDISVTEIKYYFLNDKTKMLSKTYTIDEENKKKLFIDTEQMEIENYYYYYSKNELTNEIEKSITMIKDEPYRMSAEAIKGNFITPTEYDIENYSNDEIEEKINDFINKVEIETNNDEVKFTLNGSNNCFFGSNNDYDIKEVTIDYNTGFPTSYVSISNNKMSKEIFEYKTETVTENDFDISKYDDIEVTE